MRANDAKTLGVVGGAGLLLALFTGKSKASAAKHPRGTVEVGDPVRVINGVRVPYPSSKPAQTKPAQTKPAQTQTKPAQTKPAANIPAPVPRRAGVVPPNTPGYGLALILECQQLLNKLGARLDPDGLYGPKTRDAWATQIKKLSPQGNGLFQRNTPTRALVSAFDFATISAAAGGLDAAQKPAAPSKPTSRTDDPEDPPLHIIPSNKPRANMRFLEPQSDGSIAVVPGLSQEEFLLVAEQLDSPDFNKASLDTSQLDGEELDALYRAISMTSKQRERALSNALRAAKLAAKMPLPNDAEREKIDVSILKPKGPRTGPIYSYDDNSQTDAPLNEDNLAPLPRDAGSDAGEDEPESVEGEDTDEPPALPINLERARKNAPTVAREVKVRKARYSQEMVRRFQADAGIVPDGFYGPITRSALAYFDVKHPPAALANKTQIQTYRPPTR